MIHRSNKSSSSIGKICTALNISLVFFALCVWQYVSMKYEISFDPFHLSECILSVLPMSADILDFRKMCHTCLAFVVSSGFSKSETITGSLFFSVIFVIEFMIYVGIFFGIFRMFYYVYGKLCKPKTNKYDNDIV